MSTPQVSKPAPGPKHASPVQIAKPIPAQSPTASVARVKRRHWALVASFVIMVLMPIGVSAAYLWNRAADQYISRVGFSVRTEEVSSAIEMLGGIANLSGASSTDTDILYQFLQSQELVRRIDNQLDLRGIWSRVDPEQDPYFAFRPPGTIEDLVEHWGRKVRIYYDGGTGLIDLDVLAFDPEDARAIAQAIFEESSAMINQLSAIAREDAISYARDELEQAQTRLTEARVALAEWRNENQTVDPAADTQGQMGLVTNLQAQLAEALIEFDILRDTTRENDPRITQAERRIAVIEERIVAERAVLGTNGSTGVAFADLVGEYERLVVDQEFAEQAYTAALAAFDAARNEARRQSRYLAAHVRPTLAEASEYPNRPTILITISLLLFLIWSVLALVAYSLRDRR
ncbi:capsule biosynthesis protein [Aliiroseovarius sp.]|uniref:capsule biosynthesis protein n=1 Tax=Aliiroseovarius sp. TaxID=1872442 RepID=UPI00261BE95F|nr:capsule biosynthesis protein [Aliiroseovarius sp.]